MPDLDRLASELTARHPEPWVRHHLSSFQQPYFESFDAEEISRHLALITGLNDAHPVAAQVRPAGDGDWWVEVVGYDAFQFLSTLCSLLAIRGLSIVEGQVFTSQPPPREPQPARSPLRRRPPGARPTRPTPTRGPDRRRRIVDRFRVRPMDASAAEPDWAGFQTELVELTRLLRESKYQDVQHRLIGRFVAALGRHRPEAGGLEPLALTIDATGPGTATVVRIGALDHFGFLSLTASALALCGIMIVQADIRTLGGRVEDTLWVTDRWGAKITAEPQIRELRLSLILIEHFSSYLPQATNPESALVHFSRFANETMARPDWAEEFAALDRPRVLDALVRVLGESDFLWEDFLHAQPEHLLPMVCEPDEWERRHVPEQLARELDDALSTAPTLEDRRQAIRRFRDREIFRTGVRAILGRSGRPEPFASELSDVAEVLLRAVHRVAREELADEAPTRSDGRPVPSTLVALGKCGGRELGFGSDLELMLVYDDRDVTPSATPAAVDFDRVVGLIRELLSGRRGGTFDVDFRLRPYGKSGAPATSVSAFANYYRAGGPAWGYERQALIKLRPVAGDLELAREVETLRDRYVYGPEPFDLEGCRRMRRLQTDQLVGRGTINAKYSPGGLVEAEYFVQALQIAHGGRDPNLRTASTLRAVAALAEGGWLARDDASRLRSAYEFLREMIDALRVERGHSKDLTVPRYGSEEFVLLARRMGGREPAALRDELDETLASVQALWTELEYLLKVGPGPTGQ
jgi:glutamate-ammonia-ligase adenylyltransferase